MAQRGRKPKPTALKMLEGNPGGRPLNTKEPKPEKKRSRAPKPAAAPKHSKASSRGGLGLWGKKPKH